jgi:hypothetical protein
MAVLAHPDDDNIRTAGNGQEGQAAPRRASTWRSHDMNGFQLAEIRSTISKLVTLKG